MSLLGGIQDRADFSRRLFVTAAALLVYRAGTQIPLPGLDPHALAQLGTGMGEATARISICALGISSLVAVLVLTELVKVLAPKCRRWLEAEPRDRGGLNRFLLLLALLVAAVQAAGLAVALESVTGLVEEPGAKFRLACIPSLVAGSALIFWLADQITRHGLGSGVWLVFVAPMLADLPYRIAGLRTLLGEGAISGLALLLCCALLVLALAALAGLLLAGRGAAETAKSCLWPVLLAYAALPWILVAGSFLVGGVDLGGGAWFEPSHPVHILALVGLVALFVHLYVRSQRIAGVASPPAVPPAVAAGTLAAAVLAADVPPSYFGLPETVRGQFLVVVAVVALNVLARRWRPPLDAAAQAWTRADKA